MRYAAQMAAWEARRKEIAAHYAKSKNLAETARAFGLSRERVRQIVGRWKSALER